MEYRLEDICIKVTDGSHFSPRDEENSKIPMLSVKDMLEFGFDYKKCKHISMKDYDTMLHQDCVPKKNDILVAKDGSYLKEIFVNEEENKKAVLSSIAIFRPNIEKVNPYFLCYLLKSPLVMKYTKENCVSGSALPRIILKAFKDIKLEIPELSVQNKIVSIIKSINDKIILNDQINDNLLDLIKTLYIEKIKNNYNDNFEEKTLDEFCNIFTGKKNANASENDGKYKFFTCAPEPLYINSYIHDGPAIIVSGNGAYTGRTAFYNGKFDLYQRTYGITTFDNNDYIYLLYVIVYTDLQKEIMGGTHGSAIPYIVFNDIAKFKIKYNEEIFNKLSKQIKVLLTKIKSNETENETLKQLKDTLLPKLINGEVDLDKIEI